MSKTITLSLDTASITRAIQQVQEYKDELRFKVSVFLQLLTELGLITINAHSSGQGDSDFGDLKPDTVIYEESDGYFKAVLSLKGKDVAFIEFGAGVHYNSGYANSSPNPLGVKHGLVIGSYGRGQGVNDSWWYYDDSTGEFVESHGTEAAMPLYYADQAIRDRFVDIAKKVFK